MRLLRLPWRIVTMTCLIRAHVVPKYDGTHQTFPGLHLENMYIPELYDSQKSGIWMNLQNEGGINDHEVGTGKTLVMVISSYEMKRLGIASKPMIIGLKANVHEIADTDKKVYPDAKVLYPGKEDFSTENRTRFCTILKTTTGIASFYLINSLKPYPGSAHTKKHHYR